RSGAASLGSVRSGLDRGRRAVPGQAPLESAPPGRGPASPYRALRGPTAGLELVEERIMAVALVKAPQGERGQPGVQHQPLSLVCRHSLPSLLRRRGREQSRTPLSGANGRPTEALRARLTPVAAAGGRCRRAWAPGRIACGVSPSGWGRVTHHLGNPLVTRVRSRILQGAGLRCVASRASEASGALSERSRW